MKKINTILAIAAVAVSSVFGLTSCDKENDSYNEVLKPRTEVVNEKAPEVQSYKYDSNGMWRCEANGEKYSFYIDVPNPEKGGFYTANFYFEGKRCTGTIDLKNDVMTFVSNNNEKMNVSMKAKFANNDSQKFTAEELTVDGKTVATNAAFNRIETPTNYKYTVSYAVVDPDNELASMGVDFKQLNDEIKQLGNIIETMDKNPLKAAASMYFQKVMADITVTSKMGVQCGTYPELAKSNVYVQTSVTETFGDISTALEGTNSYTYTEVSK